MKVLHITPHLGGGVGKAHAALSAAAPDDVEQIFVLLEPPRDRQYADLIGAGGARVVTAAGLDEVAGLARAADIVQFEFWNHPRLFECLARSAFPAMRSVFWSHISGLSKPVIQPGLITGAGRFVFSSEASFSIPSVAALPEATREKIAVINSGFGFDRARVRAGARDRKPVIAYLGTVDFVKMHPGFFDAIDRLEGDNVHVEIWGGVDPDGAVSARASAMRHADRIHFGGQTADPAGALRQADIFFYPLQRDHYGTAENALIEAMSLGLTPVVLDNAAEAAIVSHGETGFVCRSTEDCAAVLQRLLSSPETLDRIGANASRYVAENRAPIDSARKFVDVWRALLAEPARVHDFRGVIGEDPSDWFLATQCLPGEHWSSSDFEGSQKASKGTLAHFASAFPGSVLPARPPLR